MISALSISRPVIDRLTAHWCPGKIHSVFERALNWEDDSGNFCCLIVRGYGNIPCGAVVDTESFSVYGLRPGDRILLCKRQFWVPSRCWAVALDDATAYESQKTIDKANLVAGLDENCHAAVKRMMEAANDEGLLPLFPFLKKIMRGETNGIFGLSRLCEMAIPGIAGLIGAVRHQDRAAFVDQSRHLLGLGIGMTPSGDDFLVGLMGTLSMLRSPLMSPALAADIAREAHRCTTRISAVYVAYAAQGMIGEWLSDFIAALATRTATEVIRAAGCLVSIGSTSGREMALGAILGMYLHKGEW